jgi:hypothetical protein
MDGLDNEDKDDEGANKDVNQDVDEDVEC